MVEGCSNSAFLQALLAGMITATDLFVRYGESRRMVFVDYPKGFTLLCQEILQSWV